MRNRYEYPDDFFADTKMSFGDHLDELRYRLWAALKGLLFCMMLGFVMDTIGTQMDWPWFGIGRPVLAIIKKPAEDKMREFYYERRWNEEEKTRPKPQDAAERREREKEKQAFFDGLRQRADDESSADLNLPKPLTVRIPSTELSKARDADGSLSVKAEVRPMELALMLAEAETRINKRRSLSTLSAQEGFMVYFKVSLICGCLLAAPWILWQFWAFVGAGMYPHEKKYINKYLPFSLGLFFAGVVLCQIWVLPNAVKALLTFNEWLDLEPDLRLNEWLGLALLMPLVFGISFQTPLVMLALNQIGVFTADAYLSKWRHATMAIAVFACVVTPTPDPATMMFLVVPMEALYFLGWYLCKLFPQRDWSQDEIDAADSEPVAI